MENARAAKWDNLKAILIGLVVFGHFLYSVPGESPTAQKLILLIYTFHMPLFLFVGGLFSKSAVTGSKKGQGRVLVYVLLFLLLSGITYGIKIAAGQKADIELLGTYHVPWYMAVMALFLWLMRALCHLKAGLVLSVSVFCACLAGYDPDVGNFLFLSKTVSFFPFFAAGYYLDAGKLEKALAPRWVKAAAVVVLGGFFALVWLGEGWYRAQFSPLLMLSTPAPYRKLPAPALGFFVRLIWYALVTVVSLALIALMPEKPCFLSSVGRRTLPVYFWHVPLQQLYGLSGLAVWLPGHLPLPKTVIIALITVLLLFLLSRPVMAKPFTFLMRPWRREETFS